jgi:hypothetical protein
LQLNEHSHQDGSNLQPEDFALKKAIVIDRPCRGSQSAGKQFTLGLVSKNGKESKIIYFLKDLDNFFKWLYGFDSTNYNFSLVFSRRKPRTQK